MGRRDLSNAEIEELKRLVMKLPDASLGSNVPRIRDLVGRLTGEIEELRDRESHARFLHQLEGEY